MTKISVVDDDISRSEEARHHFLSPEWCSSYAAITAGAQAVPCVTAPAVNVQIVVSTPSGEAREFHLCNGWLAPGHVEAVATLVMDVDTAKHLFVDQNDEATMAAFMSGALRVEGDLGALLSLTGLDVTDDVIELRRLIRQMTE